jgi:tRNA(fMet)-specific endonuclease VapC
MYFLDTDTCSDAIAAHPSVFARLDRLDRDQWAISSLVAAELHFGLEKGKLHKRTAEALRMFLEVAAVVSFDQHAALHAAQICLEKEQRGRPAGAVDQLIAGHARSLGWTLVTSNLRHFDDVSGLVVESWRS